MAVRLNFMEHHMMTPHSQGNKYIVFIQFQEIAHMSTAEHKGNILFQKHAHFSLPADIFQHQS